MFPRRYHTGWIEVICGSMFSGKSEELIRRVRRAQIARLRVQIFKHVLDQRYESDFIVSHNEMRIASIPIKKSEEIISHLEPRVEVIGLDEAQFFDDGVVNICQRLADMGKRVIVAGLDQDYLGRPFGSMPQLLSVAEYITKNLAICMVCGGPANRTQRLQGTDQQIEVGATGAYEARCRQCHEPLLFKEGGSTET